MVVRNDLEKFQRALGETYGRKRGYADECIIEFLSLSLSSNTSL